MRQVAYREIRRFGYLGTSNKVKQTSQDQTTAFEEDNINPTGFISEDEEEEKT